MNISRTGNNVFIDGGKVAFIRPDGKLQMVSGKAALRPGVLEWFAPAKPSATSTPPSPATPSPDTKPRDIPPCPPMDPFAGDKTLEVIAWYAKHHPAEYKTRYAGRKHQSLPQSSIKP